MSYQSNYAPNSESDSSPLPSAADLKRHSPKELFGYLLMLCVVIISLIIYKQTPKPTVEPVKAGDQDETSENELFLIEQLKKDLPNIKNRKDTMSMDEFYKALLADD